MGCRISSEVIIMANGLGPILHQAIWDNRGDKASRCISRMSQCDHIWYSNALHITWWRHQMESFSALLAFCAGNSPVTGEFAVQRPVTRCFDVFFDLHLNKWLSEQSWGWWSETPPSPLWCHRNHLSTYISDCNLQWWKWILKDKYSMKLNPGRASEAVSLSGI